MRIVIAALLWLSFTGVAAAHALWLEPDEAGYQLYFGEFGGNLREGSPGLLDRFEPLPAAKAFGAAGDTSLKVEKKPTSFQFVGAPDATGSVVAEQAKVTERKQNDKVTRTLGRYSARYVADFSERKPLIPLDIVPTGKPGSFKVFYDGKPLPRAKAEVVTEFGWTRRSSRPMRPAPSMSNCRGRAPTPWKCRWSTTRRARMAPRPMTGCASSRRSPSRCRRASQGPCARRS